MSTTVISRDIAQVPPAVKVRPLLSRRALAALAVAALFAGAAWYGHGWWTRGRFIETTDDAYVGGNVTAIAPHVAGFISEIAAEDNQRVAAGQLLIRLDARDFQAALDHAEAALQARVAALANLQAQRALQQSTIAQAAAEVNARTARAAFTGIDARRYSALAETSAGSRQEAQKSFDIDQEAQAAMASARAGLDAAKQQLIVLDAEIKQATAAVAQAEADVQTARLNLGYTEIRSPIDGYVGNRAAQAGAYVAAGAYLISAVPARGLWVDANFKEDQLARMAPGQPATVVADVLPGHVFHGHVQSLAPGAGAIFSVIPPENATGNFTKIVQRVAVRIALDPDDAALDVIRPGLSITARVDTLPKQPS
jgi:membrane fusion protein (multidrug efflux system)